MAAVASASASSLGALSGDLAAAAARSAPPSHETWLSGSEAPACEPGGIRLASVLFVMATRSSNQDRIAAEQEAQRIRRTHRGILGGGLVVLGSQLMIGFLHNSWIPSRVNAVILLGLSLLPLLIEIPLATSIGLNRSVRTSLLWAIWVISLILSVAAGALIFLGFETGDAAAAIAATFLTIIPVVLNTWALHSALRLLYLTRIQEVARPEGV